MRHKTSTHLPGLGNHDVHVAQCAWGLPPVSPSVHTRVLARGARRRVWRGTPILGGGCTGICLLSVQPSPVAHTQTGALLAVVTGPPLGHTLPWILSRVPLAHGLLSVFLLGTSICVQPSPTGLPASQGQTVCLVDLPVSWGPSFSSCVASDWMFNLSGPVCKMGTAVPPSDARHREEASSVQTQQCCSSFSENMWKKSNQTLALHP